MHKKIAWHTESRTTFQSYTKLVGNLLTFHSYLLVCHLLWWKNISPLGQIILSLWFSLLGASWFKVRIRKTTGKLLNLTKTKSQFPALKSSYKMCLSMPGLLNVFLSLKIHKCQINTIRQKNLKIKSASVASPSPLLQNKNVWVLRFCCLCGGQFFDCFETGHLANPFGKTPDEIPLLAHTALHKHFPWGSPSFTRGLGGV